VIGVRKWSVVEASKRTVIPITIANKKIDVIKINQVITVYEESRIFSRVNKLDKVKKSMFFKPFKV
jgi:hypothetical protein